MRRGTYAFGPLVASRHNGLSDPMLHGSIRRGDSIMDYRRSALGSDSKGPERVTSIPQMPR